MEEYEDMKNDAFDALDTSGTPDAIIVNEGQEHEVASQKEQVMRQLKVGVEKPGLGTLGPSKLPVGTW